MLLAMMIAQSVYGATIDAKNESETPKETTEVTTVEKAEASSVKDEPKTTPVANNEEESSNSFSRESKMPEHIRKEMQRLNRQPVGQSLRKPTRLEPATPAKNGAPIAAIPINFGLPRQQFNPNMEFKAIYTYITEKYPRVRKDDAKKIAGYLVDYGKEHDLDPKFVAAVMARESAFNHRAVSSTGAKGLGQIKDFNFPSLNIKDPFDIKQNVSGTTAYLRKLKKRWNSNANQARLTLASYFKGPNHVQRVNGVLDTQTDKYVDDILGYYDDLKQYRERAR